ncbi:MAG: hypothetical protein C4290_10270 [Chloroflexota bacterium]
MSQGTVQEALVLRDTEGNYYLLTQEIIQAGRVPPDKTAAFEQAISGQDVSGYVFDFNKVNVAQLGQANQQVGQNIVAGAFIVGGAQMLVQLAGNTGSITQA